jgi:hypothetical protein
MSGRITTVFDIREILRHVREGCSEREIHAALGLGRPTTPLAAGASVGSQASD